MKQDQEQSIVEEHLRKSGFRWTAQRALIVRAALESHEHFTAEELLDICRKVDPKVSRATVYRTLSVLEEAGFVEGLETGDGGRRLRARIAPVPARLVGWRRLLGGGRQKVKEKPGVPFSTPGFVTGPEGTMQPGQPSFLSECRRNR